MTIIVKPALSYFYKQYESHICFIIYSHYKDHKIYTTAWKFFSITMQPYVYLDLSKLLDILP